MAQIYQSPSARRNGLLSLILGILFSFFVFLLVPITQFIADVTKPEEAYEVQQASMPPPDEFKFEEEEIEEDEPEQEDIELEKEPPKLTLDQLELALNPGMGGELAGDFAMPTFSASKSDMNLNDIFDLADLDQPPRPIKRVRPEYPKSLLKRRVQGLVKLIFIVDQNGKVQDIQIVEASRDEFAEAARTALEQWTFEPGVKNGQPVKTRVRLPIPFKIQ